MDIKLGKNNTSNEQKQMLISSKKFNLGFINKNNNISKYSNSRKDIYSKKSLISMNPENNIIKKQNNNDCQSPKIAFQNNQKANINKIFKNNYSEININNKKNQNKKNKENFQIKKENKNYFDSSQVISYQTENIMKNKNISDNNSNFNSGNNTYYSINNSKNNSNMQDNMNKTGISTKNKKDINININNRINNFVGYKKEEYNEINNKKKIKNENKDKMENNHSTNNIHNYYQTNTEIKINNSLNQNNNKINELNKDKNNNYICSNLNKMINSVNIDNEKNKINIKLKKNISENYGNLNNLDWPKNNIEENENQKDIINDKPFSNYNNNIKEENNISPKKTLNINKVKTNTYGALSNYKERKNNSINNNLDEVSSPKNLGENNYKVKNELIKKNLSINTNEKDNNAAMTTPNKNYNNYNYINLGNNSSYSKNISGSTSQKKVNNKENERRILINNNEINKLKQISLKTEESIAKIRFINNELNNNNKNNNNNFINKEKQIVKKEPERKRPLYVSPDKNIYNIEYKILSSAKINKKTINDINKSKNQGYISQDELQNNNEDNSLIKDSTFQYSTSIFKGKINNFENSNFSHPNNNEEISDNLNAFKTYKIKINKNVSNISKCENDIDPFNNSERNLDKDNKKIGSNNRIRIINKNEIKSSYSPGANLNYNINNENNNAVDNNIININVHNKYLNKNRKNNKISNSPVNNVINNNINNNIIFNKNTNLYVMNNNSNKNNNDYMDNSLDSFQKNDMASSSFMVNRDMASSSFIVNNKNKIYKKRNTNNESKTFNNFDENKKINNSPFNKSVNKNITSNIYDFDTPIQNNNSKTYINKKYKKNASAFDNINLNNNFNIRINTPIARNYNLLSERNIKEKERERLNNFIGYPKKNIIIKNHEVMELRKKNSGSPKIYKKKFDLKNRQFIIQKENKMNNITNNSYNNKENNITLDEYNIDNKFLSKQIVFLKDIQKIYNEPKRNSNKMECDKVNNFELNGNKKNSNIKEFNAIDENNINISKDKKMNTQSKTNKNIENNNSINKKKVNKEKLNLSLNNKNKLSKSNNNKKIKNYTLIKPINKCSFKHKFYFYNIKRNILKGCFYTKIYIFKENKNRDLNKNNVKIVTNDANKISNSITNDESQEVTFTQKIPVLIDNNINNFVINQLIENSFKENNKLQSINNETSDFKVKEYKQKDSKLKTNNTLAKIKENIGKLNKFNNLKNIDKEELEMTFGIEEMNNNQSKNINNNPFELNYNINDFSTINNNTNHSIVINDYLSNNTINVNKNDIKLKKEKDCFDDEEENQNEDVQVLSEDEEIKKEDEGNNNDNNNIIKKKETKMVQTTEGKEISMDIIPDKINKGLKLLERIQVKRNSNYECQKSTKSLSNSENKILINNFDDNELINNHEKRNDIFKNELLNEDIYLKKNNTFKPKKTKKLIENMTKNKKCEILNDILTGLFDKKEKEKNLDFLDYNLINNLANKTDEEEEKNVFNIKSENSNKNLNNSKIEKYIKIFNLNPIKNLEDILYKNSIDKMINFIHDIDIEEGIKKKKQSILTYNKKLKKEDKENILTQKNFLKNSNSILNINHFKDNAKKENNKNKKYPKISNKKIFSFEEIINFNKLNYLSSKENFLPKEVLKHCNDLKNYTDIEYIKSNLPNKFNSKNRNKSIEKWSRKIITNEIKKAEEYIKKMNIDMSKDNFKYEIIEILNTITVDNYEEIFNKLSVIIYQTDNKTDKNDIKIIPEILLENQYRFAEIILDKAIMEKGYIKLYAKLCYDLCEILDKIIDSYLDKNIQNQFFNGENLKSLLIGECKQRFNDYQYNEKENDYDNMILIKKKFLGNINFIVELIDVKLFSQKIGFEFLEILYRNYKEKNENDKNKYLCLEGAVDLLNKFGKIIYERKNERHLQNLENYMNDNLIPISNKIIKKEKDTDITDIPGYLKYKIINLIEKQKNNWEESLYEKSIIAKGKNKKELIPNKQNDKINEIKEENNKNNKNNEYKNLTYKICLSEKKDSKIKKMTRIKIEKKRNSSMEIYINNIDSNSMKKEKIKNTEENEDSIIKLLKKDLNEYILFNNRNSNNNSFSLYKYFYDDYNWIIINDLLFEKNIELSDIIFYFIEICIDLINSKNKISYANEYLNNIINYSSQNMQKKEREIINSRMIDLIKNIDNIIIENNNMFEIVGNLLFSLINIKLFYVNDLDKIFMNKQKQTIINISKIIKNTIIASGEEKFKYCKNFEKLQIFKNNDFFENFVKLPLINEKILLKNIFL